MTADARDGGGRTIGEVAEALGVPQHVLRFWETRFPEVEPVKRAGGRRFYRAEDVALLQAIRDLLYGEGYTIKGVQRLLRDQGAQAFAGTVDPPTACPPAPPVRLVAAGAEADAARLGRVVDELAECRRVLGRARDAAR